MVDHPDPEAEVAMVALGGEEPPCLALLNLWTLAVADGGFLEEWADDAHLSPARLSWLHMALERLRNEGFHEFLRSIPTSRAEPMGRFLHRFPRPWLDRAAATVAEAVVDGDGVVCDNAAGWLRAAAAQRVRRAFVTSVGGHESGLTLGAAALVPLTVHVGSAANGEGGIEGRLRGPGRSVVIAVDRRWLHAVWAAGAAVIDGRLVLALESADCHTAVATVVTWPPALSGEAAPVLERHRADHDGHRWSLSGLLT